MEEISIEKLVLKAKELQSQEKKWHFHMFTPDCMFNEKNKHAFVLENNSDNEVFVVYSKDRLMEEGKILVKMLHGDKIVEEQETEEEPDKNLKVILEKAQKFNEEGVAWHHHMLFPKCAFNKQEKWCIVFEDKEENKIIESLSEREPKDSLSKVEVLFYNQKK